MKNLHKLLALLLSVVMLLGAVPFNAFAAETTATAQSTAEKGDIFYSFDFDNLEAGEISGDLNDFVPEGGNPYGFSYDGSTGKLKGQIVNCGNGNKYLHTDMTWESGAGSGSWQGLRFRLDDGTTDHLITNAIETSFKFRWIGTGAVEESAGMTFFKLRRHNGTRFEWHLITAKVDQTTGELVVSALVDSSSKEVYRFAKNSAEFSDISIFYYDATATYSLYIDGKPVIESVYVGYADSKNDIDLRDPEVVTTVYDSNIYAVERKPVAAATETWAFELFRISRGNIPDAGFVFDLDNVVVKKANASSDRIYYYKNSFDSAVNADTSLTKAYNALDTKVTNATYRYQGTTSNIVMVSETLDNKANGYLDMGDGSRMDFRDHYQLFQDGNFTISFKLRADSSGSGSRVLNFNTLGDSGTESVLYITGDGYLALGTTGHVISAKKVPSTTSGEWLKVTFTRFVTNQNDNNFNFVGGNPSNGRVGYALWLDDELCGIYSPNDSGTYRRKVSADGTQLISNKAITKTALSAMPTEDELAGYTLNETESTDKLKVYRKDDGSFMQIKGTTSGNTFTFSSGARIDVTAINAKFDSMGLFNKSTTVSAEIDDLEMYSGYGPSTFARGKNDTEGVINSVNFASLERTVMANRSISIASGNTSTSNGGRDGAIAADFVNADYATKKTESGKDYITLSNLDGKSPYYEIHVTGAGGKMYSTQFVARNLVSSTDVKLMRIKRQERNSSTLHVLEHLFAEAGNGNLYFKDPVLGKSYLVNADGQKYTLAGSEWTTLETIIDERSGKLLVTYLVNGECAYYAADEGLLPAKSLDFGATAAALYNVRNAIDQRITLYKIDGADANTTFDILSAKAEYTNTLPDAEAITAGACDLSTADYSGKLYSAKITLSDVSVTENTPIIRPIRQYSDTTPVYNFDTLFVEAGTGNLYFEHDDGTKYYLVNAQRVRYSVAGSTPITPEIIFDERGDKILVTFLIDGSIVYYDGENGLTPTKNLYIGGDVVHALKNATNQKIRFYYGLNNVDNSTAKLEVVSSVPAAEEIKWADSAYVDFSKYTSIEELGDQFEWTEGVTIENGVLKIPEGGSFKWVDYNGVLANYLDNYRGSVNGQYINGFTIEFVGNTNGQSSTARGLVQFDRGSLKGDSLLFVRNGKPHLTGAQDQNYLLNEVGADTYNSFSATFTTVGNEVSVFVDGYLLGVARTTNFAAAQYADEKVVKVSITGETELKELRIHCDQMREIANESGEIFKLDANKMALKYDGNTARWARPGIMDAGVLSNKLVTTLATYTDPESGESFKYFKIVPGTNISNHTHTNLFLTNYLEDKATVFEYKFRYTPGTISSNVEMCSVRRAEDNSKSPIWDYLFTLDGKGNYSVANSLKLCDAEGNLLVASSTEWNNIAVIYDVDAGLVSYRLNGKIPYCTDGTNVMLANELQLPNSRLYRMDSAETQVRMLSLYAGVDCNIDLATMSAYTVGETANAEYIGVQSADDATGIRVVAGVDMLYYGAVGFDVEAYDADGNRISNEVKTYSTSQVYSSIVETVDGVARNIYPEDYGYRYFVTANITDMPTDEAVKLNVTPFTYVNGKKYSSSTVTVDVDFSKTEAATTKSVDVKPEGNNTSGNFSTTEVVSFTNDGALEFNGLDAEFAFGGILEGGVVSVNLTNAFGEVAKKTVLDIYVDGELTEKGIELDFGRHTLVLAKDLVGEHTFKIVKRSGGDFVCINSMSLCGSFLETPPALATEGAVRVEVAAPKSGADYGDVYVYVQTSDASGDYYIRYNFIYLNYGIDSRMIDGDNSVNPSYSTGGGNTQWNCHMYRVKEAFLYKKNANGSFTKQFNVLHQGEISIAMKESVNGVTAADFVGGYHGDENAYAISFMIDGQPLDTTKAGTYENLTTFELVQRTTIDRCNQPDTPLLDHNQHFLLDTNGLRIDRHVEVLADDFSPTHGTGYTMMATVYRIGPDSVKGAEGVEETFNVKTMNLLNANGELADDSSVFEMKGENYSYLTGSERSTVCGSDTNKINRYAEYIGDKGLYGRVGFVIDDASMEAKSVNVQVRLTYGDNKWYASIGSYSSQNSGDVVPRGEKWNLSTYYFFDYDTAKIGTGN